MAVVVNSDLTVRVLEDTNTMKLIDRQQALRDAVQKGEPKSLGVSQVMLGLMVMAYSSPLHLTEFTEVVQMGVPWWSGVMFITAGSVAIFLDKHCTFKTLQTCLIVSVISTVLSVVAVIIYSVDIAKHSDVPPCIHDTCQEGHYIMKLIRGIKSSLLFFTLAQTAISTALSVLLYRQRRNFGHYMSLTPPSPTGLIPPEQL